MKHAPEKNLENDRPTKRARHLYTEESHPLHKVASSGSVKRLRRILKDDKNLLNQTLLNSTDLDGKTPLHHAAESGSLATVKELVSFGAELNMTDSIGCPPIGYAKTPEIEEYLLERGARKFDPQYSELHLAVLDSDVRKIKRLIKMDPKLLQIGEYEGNTPLHLAVMQQNLEIVKLLVSLGADLDVDNNTGFPPVVYANKEIKRFLRKSGAKDPYHTPLHDASFVGNIRKMKRLLEKDRTQLNAQDISLCTPLHFAVLSGRLDAVKLLISQGAEINSYDDEEKLPIHYAAEYSEISHYLLQNGSIDPQCAELHLAAMSGDIVKLEALLKSEPESIDVLDSRNNSALHYAALFQQRKAVKFLLQKGAQIDRVNNDCLNLVDLAKKEGKHTALSRYIQNKIKFSQESLDAVRRDIEVLLKEALKQAREQNKKILILLGETHNTYKIQQVEKIILTIAKDLGITTLLSEHNDLKEQGVGVFEFAVKNLKMDVIGVDNHKDRERDPYSEKGMRNRNIVMAKDAAKINQDAIMIVGSAHLEGLLEEECSQIDSEQFHILPIDLSSLIPIEYENIDAFTCHAPNLLQFQWEDKEKAASDEEMHFAEGENEATPMDEEKYNDLMENEESNPSKKGWCIVS